MHFPKSKDVLPSTWMTPRRKAQSKLSSDATLAAGSARAYASDWAAFSSWCLLSGVGSLPARVTDVVTYFRSLAKTVRVATLRRKLVAIGRIHRAHGHPFPSRDPRMLAFLRGLKAATAASAVPRASPGARAIAQLIEALPPTISGIRDRALILTGWFVGCRPAELVGLDAGNLKLSARCATLRLESGWGRRNRARTVRVEAATDPALCPLRWLKSWLSVARITTGPVFRPVNRFGRIQAQRMSAQNVRLVLKRAALHAGLPPALFTGDGLRASADRPEPRRLAGS